MNDFTEEKRELENVALSPSDAQSSAPVEQDELLPASDEAPEQSFNNELPSPVLFEPEKPKKSKLKLFLIIAAVLLIIAAAVACVLLLGDNDDAEDPVAAALAKTGDDLNAVLANSDNLKSALSRLIDIKGSDKYSLTYTMSDVSSGEGGVELEINADKDLSSGITTGNIDVAAVFGVQKITSDMDFSVNDECFIYQMHQYMDGSYGFALGSDLEKRVASSYIFSNHLIVQFMPVSTTVSIMLDEDYVNDFINGPYLILDSLADFADTCTFEPTEKRDIPMVEGDFDFYSVKYDEDAYRDFVNQLVANSYTSEYIAMLFGMAQVHFQRMFESEDVEFFVGIDGNGYLSLFSMYDGYKYITLVLDGEDNIWDGFHLYSGLYLVFDGSFKQTDRGFELDLDFDGTVQTCTCDDKNGTLTIAVDDEDCFGLTYELTDRRSGVKLEFLYFGIDATDFSLSYYPLDGDVYMIDDRYTDILDFTEDEYKQYMLDLLDGAYDGQLSQEYGDDFTYENFFG